MKERRPPWWLIVLSLLVSLGMLAWLVSKAGPAALAQRLSEANGWLLAAVVAVYVVTIWFRARRFAVMLTADLSDVGWWRLTALHNFYFTFVPFKLGDLSFLPLARRAGIDLSSAAPALVTSRLYDLAALLLIGVTGVIGMGVGENPVTLLIALFVVGLLLYRFDLLARGGLQLIDRLRRGATRPRWVELLEGCQDACHWMIDHRASAWRAQLLTIPVWAAFTLSLYLAFFAFGVRLDLFATLFLMAGFNLFGALGAFSVAGIGVTELGLAGLLVLLDYPLEEAALLAIAARFTLLAAALLGTGVILALTRGAAPGRV